MYSLTENPKMRRSPFYDATVEDGVQHFIAYNRMLMPSGYGDPEGEYWRLINGVAMWDVAVERQISFKGPDARRLAQIVSARDLSKLVYGKGRYVPICNHDGVLINDPIVQQVADDEYWFSIADNELTMWGRSLARERGLTVDVRELDVAPLAVQGPKAEDVVASMLGDWVRELGYFGFKHATLDGIEMVVARSGWSKQGGFELYLINPVQGYDLWSKIREAGKPWDIGPGNPNAVERVESGLLSWGGDTDGETNPFEVRMGKYTDVDIDDEIVGVRALRQIKAEGPKRHQLGVKMEGDGPFSKPIFSGAISKDGEAIGKLTCSAYSPRVKSRIGFALVDRSAVTGDAVMVQTSDGAFAGELCELPFI